MEKFNILQLFRKKQKPLLICIHGFGNRTVREFDNLVDYLKNDFEIIIPELFKNDDFSDLDADKWIENAAIPVIENKNRDVYLLGFSMGGVIASKIASTNSNVKKLFLLAPAFDFLTTTTIKGAVNTKIKEFKNKENKELPTSMTKVFVKVVNRCKKSINNVNCPIYIFQCLNDEIISSSVSEKVYNSIKNKNKLLMLFGGGSHHIMDEPEINKQMFEIIKRECKN